LFVPTGTKSTRIVAAVTTRTVFAAGSSWNGLTRTETTRWRRQLPLAPISAVAAGQARSPS
jgi:hypothetical protein